MGKDKIFLNRPIQSVEEDWVGISTYVDALDGAVEAGAKIIAVTSDFGTGKSSLISLFRKKYSSKRKRIVNINLWGTQIKLTDEKELLPIELHKSFLYQTVNQLYHPIWRKGSYISKRLSKDYGIISICGRNSIQAVATIMAIVMWLGGLLAFRYREVLASFLNKTQSYVSNLITFLFLTAFIVIVLVLSCSEFIFSSKKSEGQRNLDENILIDLFRREVLEKGRNKHYIFVIEDLDRTDNKETVLMFLKELRKYYISEGGKNQITFIVCIKPEAVLQKEINEGKDELKEYKKIFDYILNLQKINIDNYDAILKGLLTEKKLWLEELGLLDEKSNQKNVIQIEGMHWMIRGRDIDIREIKNRLNSALSLYENLCSRFPQGEKQSVISFEKCAVATYLRSEYEKDFYQLQDKDLERLISQYVVYGIGEINENWCPKKWNECSSEFKAELWMLIENKLIDANFRVYFYNYPCESNLYNLGEMVVYNSIVYQEEPVDFLEYEQYLKTCSQQVIVDAFDKVEKLGVNIPKFVIEYDRLFCVIAELFVENLCQLIGTLRFNEKTFSEDEELVLSCVRHRNGKYNREKLINQIAGKMNAMSEMSEAIMKVRENFCKEIPEQALSFRILFQESHPFISTEEVQAIDDLNLILKIINYDVMAETSESPIEIHNRIIQNDEWKPDYIKFYERVVEIQGIEKWIQEINQACIHYGEIPDALTEIFERAILESAISVSEYVELLEKLPDIKEKDLGIIVKKEWVSGLPREACKMLYNNGMILLFICNESLLSEPQIDFKEESIRKVIKEQGDWILEYASKSFECIRKIILGNHELLEEYKEWFCSPYPYLSVEELNLIDNCRDALAIIRNWSMTESSGVNVIKYFNQKSRKTTETYDLVKYIAIQKADVAKKMFYAMDLSKLPYYRMKRARIREMNDRFYNLFEMEEKPEEKVEFLSFVGLSDDKLEKDLYIELNEDEELKTKYVDFVNNLDNVGKATIDNIVRLSSILTYSKPINDKLYNLGYYGIYVSSKTALDKKFEVEEERSDTLWPVYVSVFHSPNKERTRKLMSANQDFLQKLIEQKEYEKAEDSLIYYNAALQTKELLLYVFKQYTDAELCIYLQRVYGFRNHDVAHFFLELLKERPKVASEIQVYQNLHGKFIEPGLEGWLTKIWKKAQRI